MDAKNLTPADIERAVKEACAKVCEKRAEERFNECGTRESDTGACYYGGRHGEVLSAMDEEDDDCAKAIRALPPMFWDVPAGWQLVPKEPTHGMCQQCDSPMTAQAYYRAMLAAAPTAGQAAAKTCGPVELITEREMAIREARKSARLMLTEEGHEVVCIEPQLWEAICSRAASPEAK